MDSGYRQFLVNFLSSDENAQVAYLLSTLASRRNDTQDIFIAIQIVAEARKLELKLNQSELESILRATSDGDANHRFILGLLNLGL